MQRDFSPLKQKGESFPLTSLFLCPEDMTLFASLWVPLDAPAI